MTTMTNVVEPMTSPTARNVAAVEARSPEGGCRCDLRSYRGSVTGMKLSVSLPDDDVAFLDDYARARGVESRSAVLQRAVRLLRAMELADAYETAWAEWDESDDARAWDSIVADGLERPAV